MLMKLRLWLLPLFIVHRFDPQVIHLSVTQGFELSVLVWIWLRVPWIPLWLCCSHFTVRTPGPPGISGAKANLGWWCGLELGNFIILKAGVSFVWQSALVSRAKFVFDTSLKWLVTWRRKVLQLCCIAWGCHFYTTDYQHLGLGWGKKMQGRRRGCKCLVTTLNCESTL